MEEKVQKNLPNASGVDHPEWIIRNGSSGMDHLRPGNNNLTHQHPQTKCTVSFGYDRRFTSFTNIQENTHSSQQCRMTTGEHAHIGKSSALVMCHPVHLQMCSMAKTQLPQYLVYTRRCTIHFIPDRTVVSSS